LKIWHRIVATKEVADEPPGKQPIPDQKCSGPLMPPLLRSDRSRPTGDE
jgi:hypothetical protein